MQKPLQTLLLALASMALLGAETTQPAPDSSPPEGEASQPGAETTQPASEAPDAIVPADMSAMPLLPAGERTWTDASSVSSVLFALGEAKPDHWREANADLAKAGEEIFRLGRTIDPEGKKTSKVAKAFECTDCHNTVIEDPDLRVSDPETRLTYAIENDLPFLPGTTVYGIVDRSTWFNDDYVKKYGSLVEPAHESLVGATNLCSKECSQGRYLTDWEMDAVLTYFWTLSLTWSDLPEDGISLAMAETVATRGTDAQKADALAQVRSKFLAGSPATFGPKPAEYGKGAAGYGHEGDPARGEAIYTRSCLHCHDKGGSAFHRFRDKKGSYKTLYGGSAHKGIESYYHVIREGTKPAFDKYMPLFPLEKLSDEQVEDLRAWIDQQGAPKKRN
ncbi:MAG: cytochrome c [Deltaproteobacteria bacterium]|nr:cytochrome c [Deltaproteobacteria bacterium]